MAKHLLFNGYQLSVIGSIRKSQIPFPGTYFFHFLFFISKTSFIFD